MEIFENLKAFIGISLDRNFIHMIWISLGAYVFINGLFEYCSSTQYAAVFYVCVPQSSSSFKNY